MRRISTRGLIKITVLALAAIPMQRSFGQVDDRIYRSFSIGVLCGEQGYDAGVGMELGTPSIINKHLSLKMRGSLLWLETYKGRYDTWIKYKTLTTSLIYSTLVSDGVRAFAEAGPVYLFTNPILSNKKIAVGVTSSLGTELFIVSSSTLNICYYFSGGITSHTPRAEKTENTPDYKTGFVFTNGFRFYFTRN